MCANRQTLKNRGSCTNARSRPNQRRTERRFLIRQAILGKHSLRTDAHAVFDDHALTKYRASTNDNVASNYNPTFDQGRFSNARTRAKDYVRMYVRPSTNLHVLRINLRLDNSRCVLGNSHF